MADANTTDLSKLPIEPSVREALQHITEAGPVDASKLTAEIAALADATQQLKEKTGTDWNRIVNDLNTKGGANVGPELLTDIQAHPAELSKPASIIAGHDVPNFSGSIREEEALRIQLQNGVAHAVNLPGKNSQQR